MACADTGVDVDVYLWALTRHKSALVPLRDAARLMGMGADEAADLLADLETEGWVESHEVGDAVSVILSALGAERLGVELWPNDAAEVWDARWIPAGSPPPRERRPRNSGVLESDYYAKAAPGSDGADHGFDSLPDPLAADPVEEAAAAEHFETPRGRDGAAVAHYRYGGFYPRVLLGLRPVWFATERAPGDPCPGCGGRPLGLTEACLYDGCNRAGLDSLLPPPPPVKAKPAPRANDLVGGTGGKRAPGTKAAGPVPLNDPVNARPGWRKPRTPAVNSFSLAELRRKLA